MVRIAAVVDLLAGCDGFDPHAIAVAMIFACACSGSAPPAVAPPPKAAAPKAEPLPPGAVRVELLPSDRQEEGEGRCAAALPGCAHVFAEVDLPPSPCARRGSRCMEPMREATHWLCRCAACTSDADCESSMHCQTEKTSCPTERVPGTCEPGPAGKPLECPAPP